MRCNDGAPSYLYEFENFITIHVLNNISSILSSDTALPHHIVIIFILNDCVYYDLV